MATESRKEQESESHHLQQQMMALFIVQENPQHGWGFQKALAMPSPAAAESLPCVRGGVTALSRDGGVVLIVTIPQSPLCGDSPLYTRGP